MLAHLATIFIEDMAQAENRFVRRFVKDQGANSHQRVEPATCLIDRFSDKVSRIGIGKRLLRTFFVGISPLRKWHSARVIPAVDNFAHSGHSLSALRARECDLINEGTMRIGSFYIVAGEL